MRKGVLLTAAGLALQLAGPARPQSVPAGGCGFSRKANTDGVEPFSSGDMEEADTYTHSFTAKGVYKYVCKYHEAMGMTGTVGVGRMRRENPKP